MDRACSWKILQVFCFCFCLITSPVLAKEVAPVFPKVEKPQAKLFPGEKLTYKIFYLGLPVGEAIAQINEIVTVNGRRAYPIDVTVHSYRAIDFLYKVRDEHRSFLDVETFASLKYEKKIHEGRKKQHEIIEYDQDRHTASYFFPDTGIRKVMAIPEQVQDQLSCGYFFRTLEIKPESSVFVPVNADFKNWSLEVKLHQSAPMKIEEVGTFDALEAEPLIQFQGIFVKKGKIHGWLSLDERRIPLKMKVKVPVLGSVTAELIEYQPGALEAN